MPFLQQPLILFTDVEGTLLATHTQSWQPAGVWLSCLKARQIPIILCSSKTVAEMQLLQQELALTPQPLIAENGAIIQLPGSWQDDPAWPRLKPGVDHEAILHVLHHLRASDGYKFTLFSEVSEQTLSELTGMNIRHAALAKQHEASESLIWRDSDEQMNAFATALHAQGLQFVAGARFWHVLDRRAGKAQAVSWLLEHFRQRDGVQYLSLGLGDGPNDAPLLDTTDYAVVIKGLNRDGVILRDDNPLRVFHTLADGPEGWCEGLDHWLGSPS